MLEEEKREALRREQNPNALTTRTLASAAPPTSQNHLNSSTSDRQLSSKLTSRCITLQL